MRQVVMFGCPGLGGLVFALGFASSSFGRSKAQTESVPLAVNENTDKVQAAIYVLAGAVLLAGGVVACQFDRPPAPKP